MKRPQPKACLTTPCSGRSLGWDGVGFVGHSSHFILSLRMSLSVRRADSGIFVLSKSYPIRIQPINCGDGKFWNGCRA